MPLDTAAISADIMHHVHEALFTFDRAFNTIPLLAEFHAILDGGIRHKLTLREGVRFHNGKSMTSADVVASLTRWGRVGSLGRLLWKNVTSLEAEDPCTVVLHLRRPSASLIFGLAEDRAAIYPKESVEAAGDGELTEFIGTGPYRLVEYRRDRHIRLGRFADYAPRTEPPNGLGGRRTAHFDEIIFVPVPDPAARLAGVESGDYHFGELIQRDQWDRIRLLPQLTARIVKPHGSVTAVLNHARGPMTNKFLRQAFQAALDMEPILVACMGNRIFYRLDPGLFFPEQAWHSTAGMHLYNQHDKVKAQRLLKQAAYAGQSLRWLTTKDFDFMFKSAEVATHQLKTIGLAIDLQVVDWATLNSRAQNPELWDVASTAVILQPDPGSHLALRSGWWGSWCLEEKELLLRQLQEESDAAQRKRLVDRLQAVFYEDVGYVKMGDGFSLDVVRTELRGELRIGPRYCFWNSWLTT
jgi:peptide/nickel transport system substrate-binding protein